MLPECVQPCRVIPLHAAARKQAAKACAELRCRHCSCRSAGKQRATTRRAAILGKRLSCACSRLLETSQLSTDNVLDLATVDAHGMFIDISFGMVRFTRGTVLNYRRGLRVARSYVIGQCEGLKQWNGQWYDLHA